jgi:predicted TIM-barrel fold metal-dependent hydrolase
VTAKPLQGIDTHAHVFSAAAAAVAGARYRPAYAATLGDWRSRWVGAGITHGVVVQPSFFGSDNSETLAAVAADPAHLRAVAVIDPVWDDAMLDGLHARGVRAFRLNLKSVADYRVYAALAWAELFTRAHALGWHVEVYVDTGRLPEISPALAAVPIAVVFDHFGNPGATPDAVDASFAAVASLARERPVWAKLSGAYRLGGADPVAMAARWIDAVGPGRLVWGSDWPWTAHEARNDYGRLRAELDRWVGAAHVRAILWDNAAGLYGFA